MKFVTKRAPPASRASKCDGEHEDHLTETGVMLAIAEWMFREGASVVRLHPDGMHPKSFNTSQWLQDSGFTKVTSRRITAIAGRYQRGDQTLEIAFRPGFGDIRASVHGHPVLVEAKGGCINTRHPAQVSKLRRGLHEAIGVLVGRPSGQGRRIAAVARHRATEELVEEIAPHCLAVGIELALVSGDGHVHICSRAVR